MYLDVRVTWSGIPLQLSHYQNTIYTEKSVNILRRNKLGAMFLDCKFFYNFKFCLGGTIIIYICVIGTLYLNSSWTINELTVYQVGNIEIKGKNYFGDNKSQKFSFSEYDIVSSNKNKYSGFSNKIKLTSKYYKQYQSTLKAEETIKIKIKE